MQPKALFLMGIALVVTSCVSIDLPEGSFAARGGLGTTSERIADRVRTCWFQSDDGAFAVYRQETEITSLSGQPRILLVNRDERGGLPQLVINLRSLPRVGTVVSAFGPLTQTPLVTRINGDLERWARGSRACQASG